MSVKKMVALFHLFFWVVLFIGFLVPHFFYWVLLIFNLSFLFFNNRLGRLANYKSSIFYLILPWVFVNGLFFYSSLLVSMVLIAILLALGVLLSFYYFIGLKKHLSRRSSSSSNNFFIWTDVLGLLSVFLVSSFVYGLNYFLNISNFTSNLIIVLVLFLSAWRNISVILRDYKNIIFLSSIFILGFIPLVVAISFLPFNFNVLGLMLSVFYYSALNFLRFYFSNSLTIKKIKFNLLFVIAILLIIFLTVKWR